MSTRLLALLCVIALPATSVTADEVIRALDAEGLPGTTVTVTIEIDLDEALRGFSFGLTHDDEIATVAGAIPGEDIEEFNESEGPDYFYTDTDPADGPGIVIGCIFALPPSTDDDSLELDAGDGYAVVDVDYEISDTATGGDTSTLEFSADLGETPVAIVLSGAALGRTPDTESGLLSVIEDEVIEFLRGDADTNGSVSALLDALAMMSYAFVPGSDELLCLDAADVDDSGSFSALLDSLFLLNWQFNNGDAIPDPGAVTCDVDPTDDSLGCETPPDCS